MLNVIFCNLEASYSEHFPTVKKERFIKIVDRLNRLTMFVKSSISDVFQSSEYTSAICVTKIQSEFTCSKLTIETLEQGGKYVQS